MTNADAVVPAMVDETPMNGRRKRVNRRGLGEEYRPTVFPIGGDP